MMRGGFAWEVAKNGINKMGGRKKNRPSASRKWVISSLNLVRCTCLYLRFDGEAYDCFAVRGL